MNIKKYHQFNIGDKVPMINSFHFGVIIDIDDDHVDKFGFETRYKVLVDYHTSKEIEWHSTCGFDIAQDFEN